ncbi:MAG: hypothetical protein GXN91_05880 [Epsilonproteobacteria bacterium]|nr:hypothetical protein [Campylobacterota bacterium]
MQKYTNRFALIHWLHAILISMALLGGALGLPDLPKEPSSELESFKMHMIVGALTFIVLIIRIYLVRKEPELEELNMSEAKKRFVKLIHRLIYIFIGLTALSGMATAKSSNLEQVAIFGKDKALYSPTDLTFTFAQIHAISAYILAALIFIHIIGVIIYILQGNRDILKRVWF